MTTGVLLQEDLIFDVRYKKDWKEKKLGMGRRKWTVREFAAELCQVE